METYVIYGPPGTGKTRTLVDIASRNKGKDFFLTFTKAATVELRHRIGEGPTISTIHALAFKLAGVKSHSIAQRENYIDFGNRHGYTFSFEDIETAYTQTEGDALLALYNRNKATPCTIRSDAFFAFKKELDVYLESNHLVDFCDILTRATIVQKSFKIDRLFIDEAQDLSTLQWQFIDTLITDCTPSEVYVVGDDDQCIYEWGGAFSEGMARFNEKYSARVKILDQSHRVSKSIHAVAEGISSRISKRLAKHYQPTSLIGNVYKANRLSLDMCKQNTLFLYRCHAMRIDFINYLMMHGVLFDTLNGLPGPLQHPAVIAARLQYKAQKNSSFKLSASQSSSISRYLGSGGSHVLDKMSGNIPNTLMMYLNAINFDPAIEYKPTITLSTIHGVKGMESDNVVILDDMSPMAARNDNIDAELRVFYVGVTRARHSLTVLSGKNTIIFN